MDPNHPQPPNDEPESDRPGRYRKSSSRSRSRVRHLESSSGARRRHRSPSRQGRRRSRSRSLSPYSARRTYTFRKDNQSPSRCLGVFGLSLRTTERILRDIFSCYGPIDECTVVLNAYTGQSRGFGFIYFKNLEEAKAAKEKCDGMDIDGRRIRVDFSFTNRPHSPTPGTYWGKPTVARRRHVDEYYGYKRSPSPYFNGPFYHQRRRERRSRS